MTNYYKTKFEGKVEQMVQSSIASSQLSGRPMLTPVQDVNKKEIEDLGLNASFHYKKLDVLTFSKQEPIMSSQIVLVKQ